MKKFLLLLTTTFFFLGCDDYKEKSSLIKGISNIDENSKDIIVVKVKLVNNLDFVKNLIYCGSVAVESILKYQIIEIKQGIPSGNSIRIRHLCPRESYENGILREGKISVFKLKRQFGYRNQFQQNEIQELNVRNSDFSSFIKYIKFSVKNYILIDKGYYTIIG